MAEYGVTPEGFRAKPLETIESEIDTGLKEILGESAGTEPDGTIPLESMAGQLKVLLVDGFSEQWDLQEAVYASLDPNKATGASQDAVASITGTIREGAQQSSVFTVCVGDNGTVLPVGRVAKVASTLALFVSQTEMTIATLAARATTTAYAKYDLVTNSGNVYCCTTAGTSDGGGGPTTTSSAITDGTVIWCYVAAGTAADSDTFLSSVVGEIGALTQTLTTIDTPVSGWNAVSNPFDAVVGRELEEDPVFRLRRDSELAVAGNTTVDTIRANLLKVNEGSTDPSHLPPDDVKVFFNDTDFVDADGLPPHSIECLVRGGTDADIAQEIWDSVGAGTATFGTTTASATDSEGNSQIVRYTRPTAINIYVTAVGRYDASKWPSGSEALVAQAMLSALLTYTEDYPLARDVRVTTLSGAMMFGPSETDDDGAAVVPATEGSNPVTGLLEVESLFIGLTVGPVSSAQLPITRRQYAAFDSARCTITATTEDP